MDNSIIVALITGGVTLVVCLLNNHYQNKKSALAHEENIAVIGYKIDELKKQVEKHNGVIERVFKLEGAVSLIDERQKVANHRIDDLEKAQ